MALYDATGVSVCCTPDLGLLYVTLGSVETFDFGTVVVVLLLDTYIVDSDHVRSTNRFVPTGRDAGEIHVYVVSRAIIRWRGF